MAVRLDVRPVEIEQAYEVARERRMRYNINACGGKFDISRRVERCSEDENL